MSRYVVRATYYINHDDRRAVHSTIACENYEDAGNIARVLSPYRVCEIMYRVHSRRHSVLVPVDTIVDVAENIRADMDEYTRPGDYTKPARSLDTLETKAETKVSNGGKLRLSDKMRNVPLPPVPSWDEDDLSIDGAV